MYSRFIISRAFCLSSLLNGHFSCSRPLRRLSNFLVFLDPFLDPFRCFGLSPFCSRTASALRLLKYNFADSTICTVEYFAGASFVDMTPSITRWRCCWLCGVLKLVCVSNSSPFLLSKRVARLTNIWHPLSIGGLFRANNCCSNSSILWSFWDRALSFAAFSSFSLEFSFHRSAFYIKLKKIVK